MTLPNAPSVDINLFDLSVYQPQVTDAIVGIVGPSTKGDVNVLTDITDEGNFVSTFGRPSNTRMYAPRAAIRYLKRGNRLKFNRIAGVNLRAATLVLNAADGRTPILTLTASSAGTWANDDLRVSVTHNSTSSYNLFVYFLNQLVESFINLDNGNVVTKINNGSARMTVAISGSAGATFPAATINSVTGAVDRVPFAGGDDGAFATTNSSESSTGPVAGKRFNGKMDTVAGSRVFQNILSITAALAGKTEIRGSLGMAVVPGTFTIRVQTAVGPTFVELADNGVLSYGPGGAGLGILAPSAGAHTGYIDYRTGNWGVRLSGATTFLTGTVDGIWTRANTESVGGAANGVGAYAGNLSVGPVGVGFFTANRLTMTVPVLEQVGVPTGGATTASSEATLKTLAGWVVPGSVKLTPRHATSSVPDSVYDDGFGGWRTAPNGGGSPVTGTVDYRLGTFSVTWPVTGPAMPAGGTLEADYAIQLLDMGGGAVAGPSPGIFKTLTLSSSAVAGVTVASTDVGSIPYELPIFRGSVKITISDVAGSPFSAYDDGVGGWLTRPRGDPRAVAVTGSITYTTGAWTITPGAAVTGGATIITKYTQAAFDQARRALRGTGPQFVANTTANAAGLDLSDPSAADSFNGQNWLDHRTGAFAFKLNLITTGSNTFDLKNGAAITAVYAPASLLGFGDGTAVVFTGTLAPAPFRREANRLVGFQGGQLSTAGAGDPQVTFAALGTSASSDFWSENVALSTDPDNKLNFRNGLASIKWTSAPLADEAVFVIAEETVLHVTSRYPGDIGNERSTLTSGLHVIVESDTTLANSIKLRVMFGTTTVESFGQALTIQSLADKVNDDVNGSDFITVSTTAFSDFIGADVDAAQPVGMNGAFTIADVIGAKTGTQYTGLQQFQNHELVAVDWLLTPGQWHRGVITAMRTLVEAKKRRAIGIVSVPDEDDPFEHKAFVNGHYGTSAGGIAVASARVPYPPLAALDSSLLAVFVPWVGYLDAYSNENVFEPFDGDAVQLVAATPHPWFPIAGLRRGRVLVDQLRYSASEDDRDLLYGPVGNQTEILNVVARKEGRGLVLLGQRTAQRNPTSLDRINVRWTCNVLMRAIDLASQEFLFEINDAILHREVSATLNGIVKPVIERRGLTNAFVVVDGTTNPPDVVDRNELRGKLFIQPTRAVEYIIYDMVLTPTGASFENLVVG